MKKITGVILSAGSSSRMGVPKAILRYGDHSFLTSVIDKIDSSTSSIHVVLGYKSSEIKRITIDKLNSLISEGKVKKDILDKVIFSRNEDYEKGMLTSLKLGIQYSLGSDWMLYHFVDQPGIPRYFYKDILDELDDRYDWIQPVYQSMKGHPIYLHRRIFEKVLNIRENGKLSDLKEDKTIKTKYWDSPAPEILQDYDTPLDLADAKIKLNIIGDTYDEYS